MAVNHPIFARYYIRMSRGMEAAGMAGRRRAFLAELKGEVIEVGAGHGLNFAHYPAAVTRVLAIEPEPRLRDAARAAAPEHIEVADGLAERLPAEDGAFDAAVVTLVLCSVPDQQAALAEIRRVLKPGGHLYFIEHVRADTPGMRRLQRVLDGTIYPRLSGGCHLGRDTLSAIKQAGFTVDRLDRYLFPEARMPASFHIQGRAVA